MNKNTKYAHVFEPIRVGRMTLKNRIVIPPMMPCLATPEGRSTVELSAFMGRLAKTGAGLVSFGESSIDMDRAYDHIATLNLGTDLYVPALAMAVEEVHRYGAKATIELSHAGILADQVLLKEKTRISPSPAPDYLQELYKGFDVEIMDQQMIQQVKHNFVDAVGRCVQANFDMVTIHAGHGWLMGQFLSPTFNQRTDEYGGSLENRMRFPLEIIKAVHEAYGDQIALDMRVSGNPRLPEGYLPEEDDFEGLISFIKAAEPYLDMVNFSAGYIPVITTGEYMIPPYMLPHKTNAEFAAKAKKYLNIPISVAGSFVTVSEADEFIAQGNADMIGMGRASLADNEIFNKAEQGRDDEIRPCIRCVYCAGRIQPPNFKSIRCAVNPLIGRELEYPDMLTMPAKTHRVMIIGGGPAGMEACQRLTELGHTVMLYDKASTLGGMLHTAAALDFKQDLVSYMEWMIQQTMESGADIHLNTEVTEEIIREVNPDVVFVAIGSIPAYPPIPGMTRENIVWAGDVDTKRVALGDRVVVAGSGLTGVECAIGLAQEGKKVVLIDMIKPQDFLKGVSGTVILSLTRMLQKYGVEIHFQSMLKNVTKKSVTYFDEVEQTEHTIDCDNVVNALGMAVDRGTAESLVSVVSHSYLLGDCSGKTQNIQTAVLDGFTYAKRI